MEFIDYVIQNHEQIISLFLEHIELTFIAVGLSILIGVPIGILISYVRKLDKPILGLSSVIQAVPSMALLGFMIPFVGIGTIPAIIVVILYSLLPIIKNTYTGINGISESMIESAKGIGLTKSQILFKIQIPQTLPVIMAGIRISAVSAVGLMTMSAFIGGGGLGYLIFSGIRTVNNYQILAGAIPACILALFVDYFFSLIEKLVTPVSIQMKDLSREEVLKKRKIQKVILVLILLIIGGVFLSQVKFNDNNEKTITVSGKDFTEQNILCEMVSDYIESNTDISVNRKCNLGGAQVVFSAIQRGDIDLYIDYLGTDYTDILKYSPISDVNKVYQTVKSEFNSKYNLSVLKQMNFNNTYALAVRQDTALKYNLKTISDIVPYARELKISPTLEFVNREDGLAGLNKTYGLDFADVIAIDGSPRYTALMNDNSQVIDAFTTDGLLRKFGLVVLEDDKNFFPPYYAVPVIRNEVLDEYPELEELMNNLGGYLTNESVQELNYEVDELGKNPEIVANEFLKENNLI